MSKSKVLLFITQMPNYLEHSRVAPRFRAHHAFCGLR